MAQAPGKDIRILDEDVTLCFMDDRYYVYRDHRADGLRYLRHDSTWATNCIDGWFSNRENAIAAYKKSKPEVVSSPLEMMIDLHWEPRDI